MKSYLVVFFVLLSFVGFGQEEEVEYDESTQVEEWSEEVDNEEFPRCYIEFVTPLDGFGEMYSFYPYNHFQDFFPNKLMRKNKITKIKIFEVPEIGTTAITENPSLFNFYFNNKGFVIKHEEYSEAIAGAEYAETPMSGYEYSKYEYTYENKKLIQHKEIGISKNYNTYYSYDKNQIVELEDSYIDESTKDIKEYYFDNKGRLNRIVFSSVSGSNAQNTYENYIFNENDHTAIFTENHEPFEALLIRFNKDWIPILEQITLEDSTLLYQRKFTYNTYNQLISYGYTQRQVENVGYEDGKIILIGDDSSEFYFRKITFEYNDNSLLEKIIQTTNEGTCEYRVYYYTE